MQLLRPARKFFARGGATGEGFDYEYEHGREDEGRVLNEIVPCFPAILNQNSGLALGW